MQWAKLPDGTRAHAIVDGRPLCSCPAVHGYTLIEGDVPHEDRCGNCDKEWRRRGRATRKRRAPRKPSLASYKPRFTFRGDFE